MKTFILEQILSFFTGKRLSAGQLKFFILLMSGAVTYLNISLISTNARINEIQAEMRYMPEMVKQSNQQLAQMLYADAQEYSAKVISCIIKANTDILFHLDISDRERDKAIREIESRFDGIINEVEQLKNQYRYQDNKIDNYFKRDADSTNRRIDWRRIGMMYNEAIKPEEITIYG